MSEKLILFTFMTEEKVLHHIKVITSKVTKRVEREKR